MSDSERIPPGEPGHRLEPDEVVRQTTSPTTSGAAAPAPDPATEPRPVDDALIHANEYRLRAEALANVHADQALEHVRPELLGRYLAVIVERVVLRVGGRDG